MPIAGHSNGLAIGTQDAGLQQGQWSGGHQLFVQATKVGDYVEVDVPAGDNQPHRLTLYATKSYDYGILHFTVNGQKVDIPSYRVSQYDIIEVRPKSAQAFPIELARQTFGERPVPAWLQVVPGSLQVLVHQLPVRAQIDTILTEQLIVELYSKN